MARNGNAPTHSWRDIVLAPDLVSPAVPPSTSVGSGLSARAAQHPRCTWTMILAHSLDVLALVLMGAVAALLRFGDLYLIRPQLKGTGGLCNDDDYYQLRRDPAVDIPPIAIYILVILAPIVMIVLLELMLTFALRRQLVRARADKAVFFLRRCAKMLLVFLLGLCLTSVAADLLRLLVSRPRPYFLDNTFGFQRYCMSGVHEDSDIGAEERDARLSFPSHRCSVLAFSGTVVAAHAELVLRLVHGGGTYVLRALMLLIASIPALLVASQALDSRSNHWQDIVVGLLLGALLGAYAVLVLGRDLGSQAEAIAGAPLDQAGLGRPVHALPRLRTTVANRGASATAHRHSPPTTPTSASVEALNHGAIYYPHLKAADAFY